MEFHRDVEKLMTEKLPICLPFIAAILLRKDLDWKLGMKSADLQFFYAKVLSSESDKVSSPQNFTTDSQICIRCGNHTNISPISAYRSIKSFCSFCEFTEYTQNLPLNSTPVYLPNILMDRLTKEQLEELLYLLQNYLDKYITLG